MQDKYIAKLIHCKSLDEFVTMFFGLSMCKKLSVLGDDVPVPKGTIFYRANYAWMVRTSCSCKR